MFVPHESEVELLLPKSLSGDRRRAQKFPGHLHALGAVWAVRAGALRETGSVYCAPMRVAELEPQRAIYIDTEFDILVAEALAGHQRLAVSVAQD